MVEDVQNRSQTTGIHRCEAHRGIGYWNLTELQEEGRSSLNAQECVSPAPPAELALCAVETRLPSVSFARWWPLTAKWVAIPQASLTVRPLFPACLGDGCRKIGIPLNLPMNRPSADSKPKSKINIGVSLADQSKNQTGANVEFDGEKLPENRVIIEFPCLCAGVTSTCLFRFVHRPWLKDCKMRTVGWLIMGRIWTIQRVL